MQKSTPNIGFVSLGCPKNLVDSERILTELRTDGYNIVPSYENVDLVIVNTCGFIDSAVQESLEAIGEALEENGRVIVTGCLGAKEDQIRQVHPKVLEVSGPHSYETAGHYHASIFFQTPLLWLLGIPCTALSIKPQVFTITKSTFS